MSSADSIDPAPTVAEPPPSRTFWAFLRQPFGAGFLLTLGGLAAIAAGSAISSLSTILVYIAFALFISLGLDPAVRWIQERGLARAWSIVIVCVAFLGALAGVLLLIIPTVVRQISQFVGDIPSLFADLQSSDLYLWVEDAFGDQVGTILQDAQTFLADPANIAAIGGGVLQVGTTIATAVTGVVIVIVLSLYFLATLPAMKTSLTRLAPARNRPTIADLTEKITSSVGTYLGGMIVLAFVNAVFAFVMHLILGLPFPQLMAVTAFCITLIPLVGSVLFWAIASTLALFTSPVSALIFAIAYLVYMQLEAYLLTPRVMNRAISVPGSLVVIGALVGGTLLGLLGALIAIPVTASILLVLKELLIPRQDAKV
ncbi:AI-2E family transporter [Microbacterium betulae]|uniref:AI-2E family transporter n=1 Tax=Microbacterium betulae TaxID=2981139 RepID=A0AA97I6J3_9MICO|nr:AI-2E family transporter [Microbacterium sp. AB]WOF23202.1 AI-2E family transporter [Microbacterium sp. AB]